MNTSMQLLMSLALMMALNMNAAVSRSGNEHEPFGRLPGHQNGPTMGINSNGGFVAWQNTTKTSQGARIVYQRLNVLLEPIGTPVRITQSNTRDRESRPELELIPAGGAVVVWESGPRNNRDVKARFLNSQGQYITGVLTVNRYTRGNQTRPSVSVNANGDVYVVWESDGQDGDGQGVYAQRFTANGERNGAEIQVSQTIKWNQQMPAVMAMENSHFMVVWIGEAEMGTTTAGTPLMRGHIMGRLMDRNGQAQGNEFRMNAGQALCENPRLCMRPSGGFVVAWEQRDETNLENITNVYIREFNTAGLPLAQERRQNKVAEGRQCNVGLAPLGDDVLMVWDSGTSDDAGVEVHGRMVSGGAEFRINQRVIHQQRMGAVAGDGLGRALVIWVDVVNPSNTTLKAQQFSNRSNGTNLATGPSVTEGGLGPKRLPLAMKPQDPIEMGVESETPAGILLERQREQMKQELVVERHNILEEAGRIARTAAAKTAEETMRSLAINSVGKPTSTRQSIQTPFSKSVNASAVSQPVPIPEKAPNVGLNIRSRPGLSIRPTVGAPKAYGMQLTPLTLSPTAPVTTGRAKVSMAANSVMQRSARNYQVTRQSTASRMAAGARNPLVNASSASSRINLGSAAQQASRLPKTRRTVPNTAAQSVLQDYAQRRLNQRNVRGSLNMRPMPKPFQNAQSVQQNMRRPQPAASRPGTAQERAEQMRQNAMERSMQATSMRSLPVPAALENRDGRWNLRINTQAGQRYIIQSSSDRANWQNASQIHRGNGREMRLPVNPNGGQRFLRVVPAD